MATLSIAAGLLALGLLIWGAFRGLSILVLAPVLAVAAAVVSGGPALASYTQVFMTATGGFVIAFFPLFLMGAVFGRIVEETGAATALARAIAGAVGRANAIPAVVLAAAALTYGGVSLFVVAFAVWPLARALFAETGTAHRLAPATIALGAFTFTMTALPGSPQIQNAIPTPYFGTTLYAAPLLGLVAAAIMAGGGLLWLGWRARALRAAGDAPPEAADLAGDRPLPGWVAAALPVAAVLVLTWALGTQVLPRLDTRYLALPLYGATELSRVLGLWSVIGALTGGIVLALALHGRRLPTVGATVSKGAESALLPMFNTASLVGFGAVIAATPGFEAIRTGLDALSGGSAALSLAMGAGLLAGITGSASGGMTIALEALASDAAAQAAAEGLSVEVLHRVVSVATGGLDTLPHNGAVVTLLGICGLTHRQAYGDIFVVAVLIPLVALAAILGLSGLGVV